MPLYAVIGLDRSSSGPYRERHRSAHKAYFESRGRAIKLSGAMYDERGSQCGSLLIFEAPNAESVREWFKDEPFHRNDVYRELTVVEWRASLNRMETVAAPAGSSF